MPHPETLRALAEITTEQWGLFTRRQAEGTGMAWTTLARLARAGVVERVAHGVYKLSGSPSVDHLALRAAWLQLAPDQPAWARRIDVGVVSHRSAAALHGMGHLPADVHQFTLPVRRQSRRADVQLRLDRLGPSDVVTKEGILVTRPARTAAHLLADREDPQAVGQAIADALRAGEQPGRVERAIASHARAYGLAPDDGIVLLEWLLELTADPARGQWLREASAPSHDESAT